MDRLVVAARVDPAAGGAAIAASEARCQQVYDDILRDFLASKTIADLVCELDCKAPPEFAAESGGWFQERRAGRRSRRGHAADA